MKFEGRKRRDHSKKERERQLDTPKNHSQHLNKKRVDLDSILLHFGSISDPKMDTKSNPNLIRDYMPSKIDQNGVSEIGKIRDHSLGEAVGINL